jgi:hypothetical protein
VLLQVRQCLEGGGKVPAALTNSFYRCVCVCVCMCLCVYVCAHKQLLQVCVCVCVCVCMRSQTAPAGVYVCICALTNSFCSLIPTVSGRAKPPLINSYEMLGEKEAQLEFWLRMGFEDMSISTTNPLAKLSTVPCPADLAAAAKSISDMGSIQSSVTRGKQLAQSKVCSVSRSLLLINRSISRSHLTRVRTRPRVL